MRLWRISDFADLSGEGGRIASGRWHTLGRPIVYLSDHPALALLEHLVHLEIDADDLPDTYQLIEATVPDAGMDELDSGKLTRANSDWRSDIAFTRSQGDAWLTAGQTALLRVPSVVLPKSQDVLLNPTHRDARRARILAATRPPYDRRLFEK